MRTSGPKKTNEESDEIKNSKEELKEFFLVVKRLFGFSKLSDSEKQKYKKDIENIESFIFSAKNVTMTDVDNNRSEFEALEQKMK
jgi:Asp-tRNA(Asn)/Glu-tRNA(Gln) amidotransferase C subunit